MEDASAARKKRAGVVVAQQNLAFFVPRTRRSGHDRLPVLVADAVRRKVALIAVPAIVAMMSNAVVVAQTSKEWRAAKPAGAGDGTRAHDLKKR
jgi:hypothetical protein